MAVVMRMVVCLLPGLIWSLYIVNHKKHDVLFLTITLVNLN